MLKWTIPALLGFLSVCSPLFAQRSDPFLASDGDIFTSDRLGVTGEIDTASALARYRPDLFSVVNGSLLIHGLPALTLLDGRRFPISGDLGRFGATPLDEVPLAFLSAVRVQTAGPSPRYGADAPAGVVDLRLNNVYTGGEFGVFYGASGGKYGREDFETYIHGSVGTDNFQISGGAAYERSSGRGYPY
jgi:outer membrane receptor protein involved in Fe transport